MATRRYWRDVASRLPVASRALALDRVSFGLTIRTAANLGRRTVGGLTASGSPVAARLFALMPVLFGTRIVGSAATFPMDDLRRVVRSLRATPVVTAVLERVCLMIAAGVAIGAGVSSWITPLTASLLFGLEPRDPTTLALAAVLLIGTGLVAALPPAWHASHVDPSVVLRSE